MIQDVLSIKTCFELNNDPKNFQFTDDTNYAGEGIALTDVVGIFKVVGPDGITVYENTDFGTPDIDADASLVFDTVSLPLDNNGNVQSGQYTIIYTIQVIGGVQPGDYILNKTYNFTYVNPGAKIDLIADCRCGEITSTDTTSYGTSVTTIVRTHTVTPPIGSGLSPTVDSTAIIKVSPITDKTWTSEISSVITYDFPDELCVIDLIVGTQEHKVECDISLCDIFCCIKELADRYFTLQGVNDFEAERINKEQLRDVMYLVALHDKAILCGLDKLATTYYDRILEISQCEPGCSCEDDKPTLIVPVCGPSGGGGTTTIVEVCGNGAITLSANTIGDTTTYTLCFAQALLDKLNDLFEVVLVSGDGISIGVSTDPITGTKTFTITNTSTESDKLIVQMDIDFGTSLPVFSKTAENIIGPGFQASTLDFLNSADFAAYAANNNEFEIKDFLTGSDTFNPIVDSVGFILLNPVPFPGPIQIFTINVISISSAGGGSIKFTINDSQGLPLTGKALNKTFDAITLVCNINKL